MNPFAVWIGLGASFGLWNLARNAQPGQATSRLNTGLMILTASLLGARLSYVLLGIPYYLTVPIEIIQLWRGGFTWPGAIIAGLLSIWVIARKQKNPFGRVADQHVSMLPALVIFAWLGCWQIGVAYGTRMPDNILWAFPSLDETGQMFPRFPVQLIAAVLSLDFFWRVESSHLRPDQPGRRASLAGLALFSVLLLANLMRVDPAPLLLGLRYDAWLAALCLGLCITAFLKTSHKLENLSLAQ